MEEPCGERCSSDADFQIAFIINSMTLIDEEYFKNVGKVLSITWDKHVFRSTFEDAPPDGWRQEIQIHCTPQELSEKFKSCPIMMHISTDDDEEIGTVKFPLSDCFCDALLCEDFKLEKLKNEFKFFKSGEASALMDIDLIVQRSEGMDKSAFEALEKLRKLHKTQSVATSSDGKSSELLYSEFACPDALSDECKKNLALGEHFYRIINGHLVNVREKKGFCGEACDAAKNYCKELKQAPPKKPSSVDIFKLFHEKPAETDVTDCATLAQRDSLSKIRDLLLKQLEAPKKEEKKVAPKKLKKKKKSKKIKKTKKEEKKCGDE
jgi:hypothetical protein